MDYNQFFNDAKAQIATVNDLNAQVSRLKREKDKLENDLESEKRNVSNTIDQRVRKRRNEIVDTYDRELDKINDSLRKANSKRAKAKNRGIKERIAEETSALRDTNRSLRSQIRSNYKKDGVPFYCEWELFYTLFFPQNVLDVLVIILAFAVCFFAIPFGIWYLFFKETGAIALVVIYVIDILIFGGIVVLVQREVMKHSVVLKDAVQLRKVIRANERKIDNITTSIQNDTSEAKYDLGSFDDEIARIKQQLADVTMKKNDALNTFDTVTKNIITDEINDNAKPKITDMVNRISAVGMELAEQDQKRNEASLNLSNNYEVYLGKEFMTPEKIDALAEIMGHGTAANISEAIEEYKNKLYDI